LDQFISKPIIKKISLVGLKLDVSTIDPDGYGNKDRTKDLIKSGGEWISSVALESALMASNIREAAVIAIPDEKWVEKPPQSS
jgi:fatty-acyl-CoA synthase